MQRLFAALTLGFLFVCGAAAAPARVAVSPGISLVFAPGWVVCAEAAAQSQYPVDGVPRMTCGHIPPNGLVLHYMASGEPIDLWIGHTDDPVMSEDAMKASSPGFVETMSERLCALARSRPGYEIASCKWTVGVLAGHTVLRLVGRVTAANDPLHLPYAIDGFSVADRGGYTTVVALTPVLVQGKTRPVIAALQASLRVAANVAQPPPSQPVPLLTVSPAPGVSFQIPQNWIACDDATEARLTSARDSMKIKDAICTGSAGISAVLRAFDPRPLHTLSLTFSYQTRQLITPEALADLKQEDLDVIRQKICNMETTSLNATTVDCRISVGAIAGHRALVSTIVAAPANGGDAKTLIVSYEVPYGQGYMQIQLGHTEVVTTLVQPQIDAILASLHIDDTAATTAPDSGTPDGEKATPPPPPVLPDDKTHDSI